jgi:hypothetical protein
VGEDELAAIACQLVARIREDEPEANAAWLTAQVPNPVDWFRLCFALAAAVPMDQSWKNLTAWATVARIVSRGDGRPDTEEKVLQRRADLADALRGVTTRDRKARKAAA